jgi:tRNA(adenine34) deaminase
MIFDEDSYFMGLALKQAERALEEEEIPVGAVVVCQGKIIAKAYNQTEMLNDSTAHAEMLALSSAFNFLGAKYLMDCTLYVTLEPCLMCAGACYWSKIGKIVIAAPDTKRGFSLLNSNVLHPKTIIKYGVCQDESSSLLSAFFKNKR